MFLYDVNISWNTVTLLNVDEFMRLRSKKCAEHTSDHNYCYFIQVVPTIQHSSLDSPCFPPAVSCCLVTHTQTQRVKSQLALQQNVLHFEKFSVKVPSVNVPTFSSLPSYDSHQDYYEGQWTKSHYDVPPPAWKVNKISKWESSLTSSFLRALHDFLVVCRNLYSFKKKLSLINFWDVYATCRVICGRVISALENDHCWHQHQ